MALTEIQKKKYLEKRGVRCPYCDSGDLNTIINPRINGCEQITQEIQCLDCRKIWTDIYTLSSIVE